MKASAHRPEAPRSDRRSADDTAPSAAELRAEFLLDPEIVFLNHGSFGATPAPVFEAYQRRQRELERQPVAFLGRRAPQLLRSAASSLAAHLGTDDQSLVFVVNATAAINIAARSLELGPGDEVLSSGHEYGAVERTWRFLSRERGFSYVVRPVRIPVTTREEFVEHFFEGIGPRTKAISVSHITSPTALIFPVEEICSRARELGIVTVIDGAHAPGQLPLDLEAIGADFYAGNCHKWLCAPKGSGFLYARPEARRLVRPLVVSWGWDPEMNAENPLVSYIEQQGTRDIAAFLAVPDAIAYQATRRWETVRKRCHDLAVTAHERIVELTGLPPLSPLSGGWLAQMASAPLPQLADPAAFQARLLERYRIEIPVTQWNGRCFIRLSVQGYTAPEDIDLLVAALGELLGRGAHP